MQVDSIITNTITDEIRQKGHQSIRFSADGCSVLICDASFIPVYLKHFTFPSPVSVPVQAETYRRILETQDLFRFYGETVFISDTMAATLVPDPYFDETQKELLLRTSNTVTEEEIVFSRQLKNRSEHIVYSFPEHLHSLSENFQHGVKVLHAGECMISLSDQVPASEHQRGFMLTEVQKNKMEILVIKGDNIILSNRYRLKDPSHYLYHTLNTFKQLHLDRERVPLYVAGNYEDGDPGGFIRKYIRKVEPVPYFLEGTTMQEKLQFLILSEAMKCA